jgi:ribosomal-protein-alanine N-acetyltransferase
MLCTARLYLPPLTMELIRAVLAEDRGLAERLAGAAFPKEWPGRALVERALGCPADRLDQAECVLWGGRLLVERGALGPRVVGSVVLGGPPDAEGVVQVAYGVEPDAQGKGFATEGTAAVVEWALAQSNVTAVTATTLPWHRASLRVIQKVGMELRTTVPHEIFGELLLYERRRRAPTAGPFPR